MNSDWLRVNGELNGGWVREDDDDDDDDDVMYTCIAQPLHAIVS